MKTLTLLSGGLDSFVLARTIADFPMPSPNTFNDQDFLFVNYGQRHSYPEYAAAQQQASQMGKKLKDVVLTMGSLMPGNSLTDRTFTAPSVETAVDELNRVNVVPGRNAIILSIAYAIASANGYDKVATAIQAGEGGVYPDTDEVFAKSFALMAAQALRGQHLPLMFAPFVGLTKAEIVHQGHRLGVDFTLTYSCFRGGSTHCGVCGTCRKRHDAFTRAGITDPTFYDQLPAALDPADSTPSGPVA